MKTVQLFYKGYKVCPEWLKDKYREAVNFTCQSCNKHENIVEKLEPHRIIRGSDGGLYTLSRLDNKENNVKILCKKCHKLIHFKEIYH